MALRRLEGRIAAIAAAAAVVLLGLVPQLAGRTSPDVSWLLYAAGRVLEGERLYVDVVETNPPLIVWLNLVPASIARALGLPAGPTYQVMVAALAVASILTCSALLRYSLTGLPWRRRLVTLGIAIVLFPLVRNNFGQREHLALILTLPLALLAAARISGSGIGAAGAAGIGASAAVGIALKPYFVLPWLALEACVRARRGQWLRPRPETAAIVGLGALYLVLVWVLTPAYRTIAPLIAGTYYGYLRNSLAVTALVGEGAAPAMAALLLAAILRHHARHPALWLSLGALTAGYYLAALAQHKGWEYHFYPAFAAGTLLLATVAADLRRPLGSAIRVMAGAVAAAAAGTTAAVALAGSLVQALDPRALRYEPDPSLPQLLPVVRQHATAGPVLVLSWIAVSAFPLLPEAGALAGMRFNFLWMLGSLYGPATARPEPLRYREPAQMGPVERYLNEAVAEDLAVRRPSLVLVLVPAPDDPEWGLRRIDLLTYFQRNETFAAAFARYRYLATIGQYWAFERLPESAPPAPPRASPGAWDPREVAAVREREGGRRVDPEAVATILLFVLLLLLAWGHGSRAEATPRLEAPEAV